MSQYKIHSERLIETITLLKSCQQQLKNAERSIYKYENPLSFQAMTDVSRILCNMKNVRKKLNRLDDDLIALQKALIYIGDKSEDSDRQVSNILHGRSHMNIIDDAKDNVNDFMKHFQGWFESDNNENRKDSNENDDVIYYNPVHTIILNGDGTEEVHPDGSIHVKGEIEIISNVVQYSNNLPQKNNDYSNYKIIYGVSPEYCYNQKNYDKFISPNSGNNVGCTATAVAIAYSILHGEPLAPTSVPWSNNPASVGVSDWNKHTNVLLSGGTYSASDALLACYEQINNGTPVIIRVKGGHSVTVVGVRDGANINSLSMSDFLIVDPNDGKIKTLNGETWFGGIDTSWSLRVPK